MKKSIQIYEYTKKLINLFKMVEILRNKLNLKLKLAQGQI